MRHGTSNRRHRNRGNGGNGGRRNNHQRTQVFDSNGPDVRIRGTAHQVCEKYLALAKDASSSGDWTMAENYYQHAEHYQRIINGFEEFSEPEGEESSHRQNNHQDGRREEQRFPPRASTGSNDDLALPRSILGDRTNIPGEQPQVQVQPKAISVAD
ncbi:MAG: DUF4167 domain-containing protein [Alphaproteobacteria bacterium]|nr:DUF4167 domain-containing protein [Alphaproteobacteria bacterium]